MADTELLDLKKVLISKIIKLLLCMLKLNYLCIFLRISRQQANRCKMGNAKIQRPYHSANIKWSQKPFWYSLTILLNCFLYKNQALKKEKIKVQRKQNFKYTIQFYSISYVLAFSQRLNVRKTL